jgi:hypothetical protein
MPFIVIVPIGRDCDWRRAMAMALVQVGGCRLGLASALSL